MDIGQATPLGRPARRTRKVTLDTTRRVQIKPGKTTSTSAGVLGSQLSNTAEQICGVWASEMEVLAHELMKMSLEPSSTSEAAGHPSNRP